MSQLGKNIIFFEYDNVAYDTFLLYCNGCESSKINKFVQI